MAGRSPRGSIGAVVLVDDKEDETGLGHKYKENCNGEWYVCRPWFWWAVVDGRSLGGRRRCSSWDMSEFYVQEWCPRHPEGLTVVDKHGMSRDKGDASLRIVGRVDTIAVM